MTTRLDNSCTRGTADQSNTDGTRSTSVESFEERPNLVESRPASHLVVAPVELDEALVLQFGEDYVMEFVTEGNELLTTEHLVSPKDWICLPRCLGQQGP